MKGLLAAFLSLSEVWDMQAFQMLYKLSLKGKLAEAQESVRQQFARPVRTGAF